MGVLEVWDGTAHRKIGCGTHPYGRLKLRLPSDWVADRCAASTISDNFSAGIGPQWTGYNGGTWSTVSGQAAWAGTAGTPRPILAQETGTVTADVTVDIVSVGTSTAGLCWNVLDGNNYHFITLNAGFLLVERITAGAATRIQNYSGTAGPATYRVTADAVGNIVVYRNGVGLFASLSAPHVGGTKAGLFTDNSGGRWDNWTSVGALPSGRSLKQWNGSAWVTVACMVPS